MTPRLSQLTAQIYQVGLILVITLSLLGGLLLLIQHGENTVTTLIPAFKQPLYLQFVQESISLQLIHTSLFLLVSIQVLRLVLLFINFLIQKELALIILTSVILIFMLYSLFWSS